MVDFIFFNRLAISVCGYDGFPVLLPSNIIFLRGEFDDDSSLLTLEKDDPR